MATTVEIEKQVNKVVKNFSKEEFIFDFLSAYDVADSRIKRLRTGERNKLDTVGELDASTLKLFFKVSDAGELHAVIDGLATKYRSEKKPPRFAIVTDYTTLLAIDTKTNDTLDVQIKDLAKHYDFFLPLAGMEKSQIVDENPADVKAAEKMAKLYDEITKENETQTETEVHSLNVFLTRLLFCYFAEDSNIFQDNQFTNAIEQHTQNDGSDLDGYLERLFDLLNVEKREASLPEYLKAFPYVNGGLFAKHCHIPTFTVKSRRIMIEIGSLDWSEINPDIFGSMIQAVITPEHRGGLGMHYTSVPNIMKVIEPLFLDDLYEAFEKAKTSKKKLQELLNRIAKLKIFDPACGSGNFLIIAYKELRRLEMKILSAMDELSSQRSFAFSEIKLTQFYGIELDDFAHEVAILSLWLAEHQMNLEFYKAFGRTSPALPLKGGGNIVHGNATRVDWEEVCSKEDGDEIYILGNPPYLGKKEQTNEHKLDLEYVCNVLPNYKNLDYIACWFIKGSEYITSENISCAFVSTNSISQGEQVSLLWPYIFERKVEISFAYSSFMWKNNAKNNAGVAVTIIGLQFVKSNKKYLFSYDTKIVTSKINPYLVAGSDTIVEKKTKALSNLPRICNGSMPNDNGYFFLDEQNYEHLNDKLKIFYKKTLGAKEFFHSIKRYCLWLNEDNLEDALSYNEIKTIVNNVKEYRLKSTRKATRKLANKPYSFGEVRFELGHALFIPGLSAEKREYIPIGFIDDQTIVTNLAQVVYNTEVWLFGIVSSKINNIWVRATSGYFKKDIRYSPLLSYNTFPFPNISKKQKDEITELVFKILDEREQHSEKTLAQLYDPDKMPDGLREAHHQLDLAIERCYRKKPFESDEERLEYLFKLYEEMIKAEGK